MPDTGLPTRRKLSTLSKSRIGEGGKAEADFPSSGIMLQSHNVYGRQAEPHVTKKPYDEEV